MRIGLNQLKVHEAMTKIEFCRNEPVAWLNDDIFFNKGEYIIKPNGIKLLGEQINRS